MSDPAPHAATASADLSAAASRAVAPLIDAIGGPGVFATIHDLNPRTADRIRSGRVPVPKGIARDLAICIEADATVSPGDRQRAAILREWSDA